MKSYITPQIEQIASGLAAETITLDYAAAQLGAEIISISGDYRALVIPAVLLFSATGGSTFSIYRAVIDEFGDERSDFLGNLEEGEIDEDGQWRGSEDDVIAHAIRTFELPANTRGIEI